MSDVAYSIFATYFVQSCKIYFISLHRNFAVLTILFPFITQSDVGLHWAKQRENVSFHFIFPFLKDAHTFCLNKIQSDLLIHKKCPEFGLIKNEYYVLTRNFSKRPKKPVKLGNESHI